MPDAPSFAIQVSNLATGIIFLTEKLGFTLTEQKPAEDIAYLLDTDGDPMLLAGPSAQDLLSYMAPQHFILKPGESVGFYGGDLEARQAELRNRGVTELQLLQRRLGDRVLRVRGLDDYSFDFIQPATHSFEDLMAMYARSLDELDEALAGLSDAEMGLTLHKDSWNIRQIVHHIADTDILYGETMKVALSASGGQMDRSRAVGNERISSEPEYRDRPVASSVALFRTFHAYILDIVKYIPDAGERHVIGNDSRKHTFAQMIQSVVGHSAEHIDEIWEIRKKHGK